jgi:ABC-type Mn2+/Zn2+ transport system permease subunit
MSWFETLTFPFMQHALIAVFFAGIAFPLVGVFIVSLNLVPLRFAMMHVALLGGAVGLFLNVDPMFMGLLLCAFTAVALGPLSERTKIGLGTVSGYFMTLTLALSFIIFYKGNIHVIQAFSILWGNIFALTVWDLTIVILVSLSILGLIFFFFKEIQAILYDRELALAVGIPEKKLYYVIVFMLGLTIAVSMRMIGALLVDAFVLLPAMAANLVSRSLKQSFVLSSLFGLISGMSGLYASFVFDLPASSCIILVAACIIAICMIKRTLLARVAALLIVTCALLMTGTVSAAEPVAVASTSLTGAIAKAAGAREVRILTPAGIAHPPEYELKPSDLPKLEGAQVVLYAGYERMVSKLVETGRNKQILVVQLNTETSPENLISQVRKVAAALKTEVQAAAWEKEFQGKLAALRASLAPLSAKRAAVHWHAQPFARWAGLSVVQVVRPGELTPKVIADAIAQKPDVVVDILHSPVAKTIADNAQCKYGQVINFPGAGNTVTLDDLFEYNTKELLKAFR